MPHTPPPTQPATAKVDKVTWKGHIKRLHLPSVASTVDVPLSACVTSGDCIRWNAGDAWVVGKNGECKILQPYTEPDILHLGGHDLHVLIKEVTEPEEHIRYQALADYHYRGKTIHGRTSRLIVRAFHPNYPTVLGYIELATPFFMNKARSRILDAPFSSGTVEWDRWDMATLRKYIHLTVRIARTVVAPEFRGADIGQLLVKHATTFARSRWQVSGYLPEFIEISADMLKYVPFAERAGMAYVGETEGNLHRVAKDMRYLIKRFRNNPHAKSEFENISGILDQQVSRMDRSMAIMQQEGLDLDALVAKLDGLSHRSVLKQYALFHGIVSFPKPHYMAGLSRYSAEFLADRLQQLKISNQHTPPKIHIQPLVEPIILEDVSVQYRSTVRRTQYTHAVQQAFNISPDDVLTTIIKDLTLTIAPGSIMLVLGPSGSGKTSLLQLLSASIDNLPQAAHGKVTLPSNFNPSTFRDFRSKKPLIEALGAQDVRSALYLLGLAGVSEPTLYLKRYQELSKGQQYRAMLARVMASRSNVWIADEFCANLDPASASVVADNFQRAARRLGVTVVAAAPHCATFVHSLRPDLVLLLGSSWEHSLVPGAEYLAQVGHAHGNTQAIPALTIEPALLQMLKTGETTMVVCKGRKSVKPGLILVTDGTDQLTMTVKDVVCKRFSRLSEGAMGPDELECSAQMTWATKQRYPDIQDHNLVTIVRFEVPFAISAMGRPCSTETLRHV